MDYGAPWMQSLSSAILNYVLGPIFYSDPISSLFQAKRFRKHRHPVKKQELLAHQHTPTSSCV
ncbi:predicted protein [Sclerotinia sclerotiorum 1980 UF-70]|uniref:Uncharacterized protein n=1 Tax=Sclerotinia sclerotiorum (strain ATCC 18683 / 1980 / Ss-1) TaxID=665079 RepID=A7F9L3_SCLS1|nr:predicted protein [Sclerotinia sclerotiorum 1980 UF-70]EDO00424.1 predicted protein [Sclerotinia sclerotiorum 1980 UF-70]